MTTSPSTSNLQRELSLYLNLPVLTTDENCTFTTGHAEDMVEWLDKTNDQIEFSDINMIPDPLLNECNIRDSPVLMPLGCTDTTGLGEICMNTLNCSVDEYFVKSEGSKTDKNMNLPKANDSNISSIKYRNKCEALENLIKLSLTMQAVTLNGKIVVKIQNKSNKEAFPTCHIIPGEDDHVDQAIEKQYVVSLEKISLSSETNIFMPCLHGSKGFRLWLCPSEECRRAFYRFNTAKFHSLKHLKHKPYKCEYPKCKWAFFTAFKLKRHEETHLKKKDFVCAYPNCNRRFTTIYNLRWHRRKSHDKPATIPCSVDGCDKLFQTFRARETHLKSHPNSDAPYRCPVSNCTKKFFLFNALTIHARAHAQRKQDLSCTYPNCGKVFNIPCRLKQHLLQHTGQRPFSCTFENCKWAFSTASKLKRHLSTHTNERKFHCTMGSCNKSFLRSEHLRDHTLTHIGQRPFQCMECDASFTGKSRLYLHIKKVHVKTEKETCARVVPHPEHSPDGQSSDDLERAIQSLGATSDLMLGASLLPEEPLELLDNENFSTVNLRDLD